MARIEFKNDKTKAIEEMEGSDGRANVSSRSDSRSYYNSRDRGLCFSLVWDDADAAAGDLICYWQNLRSDKELVITSVGVNAILASTVQLYFVTVGTPSGGNALTPTNLNKGSANDAPASSARGDAALSGLTEDGIIDSVQVQATGHEEMRLGDRIRLGQNDAIAIKYNVGTSGRCFGVIFGYYE